MYEKILGIDLGDRRIGLALSDGLGLLAHPLVTLPWKGTEALIKELNQIIDRESVRKLVIGVPFTMKGTHSAKTEQVKNIIEELRQQLGVEIIEMDERLTTKMAEKVFQSLGKKPSKNRDKIDQLAAVFILQSYLDQIQSLQKGE
jgi:putative holliday junction resolvase